MDQNTITVIVPHRAVCARTDWREGDAYLAGGTWLLSEPQVGLRRLVDLDTNGWAPLSVREEGLEIAATCKIGELDAFVPPAEWTAGWILRQCCRSLAASFKVCNTATVGGNICMSLPAGSMISMASALEAICTIERRDGRQTTAMVEEIVSGPQQNQLGPGDLLRSILLPTSALRKRASFRRMALTQEGRSTAVLIGTRCPETGGFSVSITAATVRPVRLQFRSVPVAIQLRTAITDAVPDSWYFDDVHGTPEYRKHLTLHFAEEIRRELSAEASS